MSGGDPLAAYVESLSPRERSSVLEAVAAGVRVVAARRGRPVDLEPVVRLRGALGGDRGRRRVVAAAGAPLVRVADLGDDVGVTHRTVTRWAEAGELHRADKRGRDWWVDAVEVLDRAADPRRRRRRADELCPPADS